MYRASVLAAVLLSACYTYRPLVESAPLPGQRVSAQLTNEGSRDLTAEIGPEVLHVEGDVLSSDSDGMDLEVREIESVRGFRSDWHGEHVRLPRIAVAGLQERKLSLGGTTLLSGALVGGLFVMYKLLGGNGSSEGSAGQGGRGGN
jgi:hypothetical protein